MRLIVLFFLLSCFRYSFAQSSLKQTLRRDFVENRKKPDSLHPYWYAKDTTNISLRDTIIFHNKPLYYLEARGTCKFLNWSFTSKATISQSSYFPCVGHGYYTIAVRGSYRFKIKEAAGKTYLKLIDYKYQTYWFEVSRSLEYDSRNIAYPLITLVRLK